MSKNTKIFLIVAALAVAGYLGYRMWKNRQGNGTNSPTGALGTNLNSVAPELVGGSSGPSIGPAVSMPVNVTLQAPAASAMPEPEKGDDDDDMEDSDHDDHKPIHRQRHGAVNPGGVMQTFPDDTGGSADEPGGPGVFMGGEL